MDSVDYRFVGSSIVFSYLTFFSQTKGVFSEIGPAAVSVLAPESIGMSKVDDIQE